MTFHALGVQTYSRGYSRRDRFQNALACNKLEKAFPFLIRDWFHRRRYDRNCCNVKPE
jgi:hypothetical protein